MEKITLMLGDNYTSHEKCNYRSINHCLHILFQFRANPIKQEMEITKNLAITIQSNRINRHLQ